MKGFKKYYVIFFLAILIRLLIMPVLFHPDVKTQYFHAQFLQLGVVNIYQYVEENKQSLSYKDTFNYPPLIYFVLGGWNIIANPFLGSGFNVWLNNWGENWFTSSEIFKFLFVLKIPYLIVDIFIGGLLVLFVQEKYKKKILILWLFNPITLYIIYGMANFDILPTFFSLLAVYLFKKNKYLTSGLSLGVGISLKLFPLLFIPFFVLVLIKKFSFKQFIFFNLGWFSILVLTVGFFWKDFFALSNNNLTGKLFELQIPNINIPIFFILYFGLILLGILKVTKQNLIFFLTSILLIIYSISKFHPQWLLWVLPFLSLLLIKGFRLGLIIPLVLGYLGLVISFKDHFLTLGILSPIFPQIYDVSFLEESIFQYIPQSEVLVISRLLVAFSCLVMFYIIFEKERIWQKEN